MTFWPLHLQCFRGGQSFARIFFCNKCQSISTVSSVTSGPHQQHQQCLYRIGCKTLQTPGNWTNSCSPAPPLEQRSSSICHSLTTWCRTSHWPRELLLDSCVLWLSFRSEQFCIFPFSIPSTPFLLDQTIRLANRLFLQQVATPPIKSFL